MRTLSHEEARRTYDRIGSFQDRQAFYEDRTTAQLVAHGSFDTAERVFEFGCGTGRFAASLLADHLPRKARYRGIDLSPTMVKLARNRLAPFASRAEVLLSSGRPPGSEASGSYDRWVSTFVLDLLSAGDIEAVLAQAHRMLVPGGLLCLAGLCPGSTWASRAVVEVWSAVHRLKPDLVGGCLPVELRSYLSPDRWKLRQQLSLAPFLIPSEAIVAERR